MADRNVIDAALCEILTIAGEERKRGRRDERNRRKTETGTGLIGRKNSRDSRAGSQAGVVSTARSGRRPLRLVAVRWLVPPILFVVLPFLALLRGSIWIYGATSLPAWLGIGLSSVAAGVSLLFGTWWAARRLGFSLPVYSLRVCLTLSIVFAGFALVYISAENVKEPDIKATYRALHPVLRLSVSTLVLVDRSAMITDGQRVPEDYGTMGLAVNPNSLHFKQADGYAHAVDLRTVGRTEWLNWMTAEYFRLIGFDVLRHTGTADHLHVSLRIH